MLNVHLYPSDFKSESRIEKLAASISIFNVFSKVELVGCGAKHFVSKDGVISVRLLGRSNPIGSGLIFKLITFCYWYFSVFKFYFKSDIACINAHSLSSLPLAVLIKLNSGCKLIYDTHELETETHSSKGFRKRVAVLFERLFLKHVDHMFVVSESIADFYQKKYSITRPTVVLNAPRKFDVRSKPNKFRQLFSIPSDSLIFLYQGLLADNRGISELLEAFSSFADRKLCIVFMGYGPLEASIISYSKTCIGQNVFFKEAVSPDKVLEYTASADVGFSIINNSCLSYYYCMPNKLFEYGMAGLPVIVSNNPDMKKYVTDNFCGLVLEDFNLGAILDSINLISVGDCDEMKRNALLSASNNSWEVQHLKLESVYCSLFKNLL